MHLACVSDALVSILLELSDDASIWPGHSRDARLEQAWRDYKSYCRYNYIPDMCERKVFTHAALRMDYAQLSQKFMRAAAARYIVFWLDDLFTRLSQQGPRDASFRLLAPNTGHFYYYQFKIVGPRKPFNLICATYIDPCRLMRGVAKGLVEMENVQLVNTRFMGLEALESLEAAYYLYRSAYSQLANRAISEGVARFKLRPKQHQCEHLIYDFALVYHTNPRFDANFMGEDMVRRTKQLALASHPSYVSRHVLMKYALQVCLRYRNS